MAQSSYPPSEYVHMYPELIQTFLAGRAVDHYANEPAPSTSSQFERLSNHYQYMTFAAEFRDFVRTRSELRPHLSPLFFTWFFLGSLYNLPDSGVMTAMNTRDLFIKQSGGVIRVAYGSTSGPKNRVTLHFRTIWMPGSQSSVQDRGMFSASELTELVYKWNLDFFALTKLDIDTKYLEFTGSNASPQDFDVIWSTQAKDHTRHLLHMICKTKLTDEMFYRPFNLENPVFAMVTVKDREEELAKMKSLFEALQSTNVESVRATIAQILQNFHQTYQTYRNDMNLAANAEAYVGYITGIFVLNYRKRFNLRCDIKLLAIHEKIIFSVLPTYRLNPRLSSNVPIIFESIEFQSKPSIRLRQLKQSGMRELLPSFNTDSKLAVLAITNLDLVKTDSQMPIRVATVEINQGIVYKFLNVYEYSMSTNNNQRESTRFLNMELSHLIEQMAQVKSSLVSAHIYGQILSLPTSIEKHVHGFEVSPEEEKVSKFFYKYDNPVLASEIKTFMVVHGTNMIAFNIAQQSSRHEFTDAFFRNQQNNLFILPEGVRPENILHINVHLDNMHGSFMHLNRVVPRDLTADHSTIHNGVSTRIADLPVTKFFDDLKSKRIDDVKEVLSRCLFQDRFLFVDSLHIKAVLKGVFTSKMMSMSALEQYSGSIIIVLHQELPRLSRDYSLREMLASPMSSDNVLLAHAPVMIKISTKSFQPEDRRSVVDNTVVGFWVEYFTSMTFPQEEAQPILFPLVFNLQADEPGQLMEGAIFTTDDGLENVVSDVTSVLASVCNKSRRKRRALCSFTESEVEEFVTRVPDVDGSQEWKIDSEQFSKFAMYRDRRTVAEVVDYMALKNAKVTGSKADQLRSLITNSKALSRLNKVSKYANIGTMGLIAKDIISAVARGNYTEAATTTTFILGSMALGMTGTRLHALGLRLGLKGSKFTGTLLRGSAPLIGRLASGYLIYDLIRNIKMLNTDDHDLAVAGIVGDATFLVIDVLDIGIALAETFTIVEGVSSVIGPVGALVGALVFLGTNIYSSMKIVDRIDHVVRLTTGERIAEGFRAFFGMTPEEHVRILMEDKERYGQQVDGAYEFLRNNTRIKNYFFPMQQHDGKVWHEFDDNFISLDRRISSTFLARDKPNVPKNCKLTCFNVDEEAKFITSSVKLSPSNSKARFLLQKYKYFTGNLGSPYSFMCHNSIGITNLKSLGNTSLFTLNSGNDYVKAQNGTMNIFLIGDGIKYITGGDQTNLFVLHGNQTTGVISGSHSISNTLDLSHFGSTYENFTVNLTRPQSLVYGSLALNLFGITKIMARPNLADKVFVDCDTEFVDSGNGKDDGNHDFINVSDKMCFFETFIKVGTFTTVQNDAVFGHFEYTIAQGPVILKIGHSSLADHRILFSEPMHSLIVLEPIHEANLLTLQFTDGKHIQLNGYKWAKCSLFFSENLELRYDTNGNSTHFHGYGSSNHSALDVVKIFTPVADRLNIAFTIKSKINNETIFISHKNDHMSDKNQTSNILHNDPFAITYIRGGLAENVYIINSASAKFGRIEDVYVKPVKIFEDASNFTRTIVLKYLADQLKRDLNCTLAVQVSIDDQNLINLEIFAVVNNSQNFIQLTYIVLENHYQNRQYEKFDILIDDAKMKIDLTKRELKPAPIFVDKNTTFLILNSKYVSFGQEYRIDRNIHQIEYSYGETGCLILVEEVDISEDFETPFYIVLEDFFSEPHSTLNTLKFKFKNNIVDMNRIKKQDINEVKHFDQILEPYRDALDNQIHAFIGNIPRVILV